MENIKQVVSEFEAKLRAAIEDETKRMLGEVKARLLGSPGVMPTVTLFDTAPKRPMPPTSTPVSDPAPLPSGPKPITKRTYTPESKRNHMLASQYGGLMKGLDETTKFQLRVRRTTHGLRSAVLMAKRIHRARAGK